MDTTNDCRFENGMEEANNSCKYLPFGAGPRCCPAGSLVNMLLKVALVHIVHSFELKQAPETQV